MRPTPHMSSCCRYISTTLQGRVLSALWMLLKLLIKSILGLFSRSRESERERGVHSTIVRIWLVWYRSQTVCIRWVTCKLEKFHDSNGKRQGSVRLPCHFNIYVDESSATYSSCHAGCLIDHSVLDHFAYDVDDIV